MPAAHDEPAFVAPRKLGGDVSCSRDQRSSTSHSRSTSAGSMLTPPSSPECGDALDLQVQKVNPTALPEFEYPVPYTIRNTFVDTGIGRPLSLEEFYEERRVHSCPVEPPCFGADEGGAMTTGGSMMASVAYAAVAASAAAAAATRCWMASASRRGDATPSSGVLGNMAPVLRLAEWVQQPELGSPQLPTVGSEGHNAGTCKPCAFYHSKGCSNGVNCSFWATPWFGFCHLCPADEKKRRQKEKGAMMREARRMGL